MSLRTELQRGWRRILEWYMANTPSGTFKLAKGVSKKQFATFERKLGLIFPDEVRESYLLHNGTRGSLLYYGTIMSLQAIEAEWTQHSDWQKGKEGYGIGDDWVPEAIKGPIKPIFWNLLRIPITNMGGACVMVDLDPGKGGKRGQIIKFCHEVGPERVLAKSLAEWLSKLADGLEAGKFVYVKAENTVAPPGMYD